MHVYASIINLAINDSPMYRYSSHRYQAHGQREGVCRRDQLIELPRPGVCCNIPCQLLSL